jgi:methionyl-tRNA formyltransferase
VRTVWVSFDVIGRRCLEACAETGEEVAAVVTLPGPIDPNRSGQCSFDDLGVPLIETEDVNSPQTVAAIREAAPDAIFVVGWSQLIRGELLGVAPQGMFGMHPTLLPRHRGRAAIPWTILTGLARTGVTLFEIVDPSADSGPIIGRREVEVEPEETATTLYDKLLEAHVELIREHVPQIAAGRAPRTPQDAKRASAWPKRTPADGIIDWDTRAPYLHDWIRAQTRPYPGAFTYLGDEKLVIWQARPVELETGEPAGTVVELRPEGAVIACGEGGLLLEEIEPERPIAVGDRLG